MKAFDKLTREEHALCRELIAPPFLDKVVAALPRHLEKHGITLNADKLRRGRQTWGSAWKLPDLLRLPDEAARADLLAAYWARQIVEIDARPGRVHIGLSSTRERSHPEIYDGSTWATRIEAVATKPQFIMQMQIGIG